MTGSPSRRRAVLVFCGGDPPGQALDTLPVDAFVIAADSGARYALDAGRHVDLAVGDFDSVDPQTMAALERAGTLIERHPAAKDQTDLALALDLAVRQADGGQVVVVGGGGGRLDHALANLLLLADGAYASAQVEARIGAARVFVVRGRRSFTGEPSELVSLIAVNGPARGVSTEGLLFALHDADMPPGSSWGVSNQLLETRGAVEVREGVLLVVLPGERGVLGSD